MADSKEIMIFRFVNPVFDLVKEVIEGKRRNRYPHRMPII